MTLVKKDKLDHLRLNHSLPAAQKKQMDNVFSPPLRRIPLLYWLERQTESSWIQNSMQGKVMQRLKPLKWITHWPLTPRILTVKGKCLSMITWLMITFCCIRLYSISRLHILKMSWVLGEGKKNFCELNNNSIFSCLQMAGYTICPALAVRMSPAPWPLWLENASPQPPSTPASQCSLPSMCLCATHTTAPCPTVRPRTTSSSTSAWAGRQRVHGKGHDLRASCVSFLLSVNAGQHTGLWRFLSLEAPEG